MEVNSYPRLQEMGAYSTLERYSALDAADVVEYARLRGIRVMLEVHPFVQPPVCPPICQSACLEPHASMGPYLAAFKTCGSYDMWMANAFEKWVANAFKIRGGKCF